MHVPSFILNGAAIGLGFSFALEFIMRRCKEDAGLAFGTLMASFDGGSVVIMTAVARMVREPSMIPSSFLEDFATACFAVQVRKQRKCNENPCEGFVPYIDYRCLFNRRRFKTLSAGAHNGFGEGTYQGFCQRQKFLNAMVSRLFEERKQTFSNHL